MTLNLLFNISEIAIITGDNPYKSKKDFLIDYWKKHYKSDFEECQKAINYINKETDEEVIQKISNKNNINIESEMKKCFEINNLETLNETKKIILEILVLIVNKCTVICISHDSSIYSFFKKHYILRDGKLV